jgi:PD-(D/E)XK nuclease superfamily protein
VSGAAAPRASTALRGDALTPLILRELRMFASKHPFSTGVYGVSEKFNGRDLDSCRTSVRNGVESPSAKGARSQAEILAALAAAGQTVLLPWGGHHRYDFVLDEGAGRFSRVQCKTGVIGRGAPCFRTASADRRRPMGDPYIGQVDAFAVYSPELDASFLVPIEDLKARQVTALRVRAPASSQRTGIRWAEPYVLRRNGTISHEERKTGFEPATLYLASRCATTAPLPLETPNDIEPHP